MKYLFGFGVLIFLFYGCCGKVDCTGDNYIKFRLLNKIDSTDLVFCGNNKYSTSNILLYAKNGNKIDTIHKSVFYNYSSLVCDSTMIAFSYSTYEKIYLRLDINTIDSFELTYNKYHYKCCGDGFDIKSLRYNSNLVLKDSTNAYNLFR